MQLFNQKGVTPPTGVTKSQQEQLDNLSKLTGTKFDK